MVDDCYIRILDESTGQELLRYNLKEKFTNEDVLEFGRLYRSGNGWEFEAMGRAYTGSLQTLVDMYT
jgi:tellurium resistance protein TerD